MSGNSNPYCAALGISAPRLGNSAVSASPEYMRPEPASVLWVWQVN